MSTNNVTSSGEVLPRIDQLVVMPVAGLDPVTLHTLAYARSLTDNVVAAHVASDEQAAAVEQLEASWQQCVRDVPLVIVESRSPVWQRPLSAYVAALHRQQPDRVVTVLIPEFAVAGPWDHLLRNESVQRLKRELLARPGIVVRSVPFPPGAHPGARPAGEQDRSETSG